MHGRYTWKTASRETVVVLVGLVFCVPLYLLIAISLKTTQDSYIDPLSVPTDPNWASYSDAFAGAAADTPLR